MGESLFSNQVEIQLTNLDFPLIKKSHDDRIFKHVTFPSDSDVTLRLKMINHNSKLESEFYQKVIPLVDWDPLHDKLRIKAVLSTSVNGVQESYWVTQKHFDYHASSHNQYRVRGVSKQGYQSDWMYSELRDEHNDLIVYEMLYDLLDLVDSIQDKNLSYLIDHSVNDTLHLFIDSFHIKHDKSYGIDEEIFQVIQEWFAVFKTQLKESFYEHVMVSPQALAELAKKYDLLDFFHQLERADFFALLLESYLEEYCENIVQQVNYEILVSHPDRQEVLLEAFCEFDIKDTLIKIIYSFDLSDHFIEHFNDMVKLLSDPTVYEFLSYNTKEEISNFFRTAVKELFIPLNILDRRGAELFIETEDKSLLDISSEVVQYDLTKDGELYSHLLLYDIFEILKEQNQHQFDFKIYLIDKMLGIFEKSSLSLYLEYNPMEFLTLFTHIVEKFTLETLPYFAENEQQVLQWKEEIKQQSTIQHSFKEHYQLTLHEISTMIHSLKLNNRETKTIQIMDFLDLTPEQKKEKIDHMFAQLHENIEFYETDHKRIKDFKNVLLKDKSVFLNNKLLFKFAENVLVKSNSDYKIIYQNHVFEKFNEFYKDHKEQMIQSGLLDKYIKKDIDEVKVYVGEISHEWPLGKFILGSNTLKGNKA